MDDRDDKRNPIASNDLPEAERVVKAWLMGMLNDENRMTNDGGADCRARGPTTSQPGATPQERGPKTDQGPTARPISAATPPPMVRAFSPPPCF